MTLELYFYVFTISLLRRFMDKIFDILMHKRNVCLVVLRRYSTPLWALRMDPTSAHASSREQAALFSSFHISVLEASPEWSLSTAILHFRSIGAKVCRFRASPLAPV